MTQLIKYEAARAALAEAHRVDEVKDLRDKAQAMAAYARQAKDTAMVQMATEIKVRAERRLGELLIETRVTGQRHDGKNHTGQGTGRLGSPDGMPSPTLESMGISYNMSSRAQALASIPAGQFEKAVAAAKDVAGEVTTAFVNRHAAAEKARVEAEDARRAEEARIAADKRIAAEKVAAEERAARARAEAAHATEIRARKAAEARALAAEAEAKQRAADLKRREDRQRKAEQEDAAKRAVKDRGRLSEQVYKLAKLLPGAAASPLRVSAPEAFRESWQHLNGLVAEALTLADNLKHATTGMSPARWEQIQRERAEKERRT